KRRFARKAGRNQTLVTLRHSAPNQRSVRISSECSEINRNPGLLLIVFSTSSRSAGSSGRFANTIHPIVAVAIVSPKTTCAIRILLAENIARTPRPTVATSGRESYHQPVIAQFTSAHGVSTTASPACGAPLVLAGAWISAPIIHCIGDPIKNRLIFTGCVQRGSFGPK